MFSWCKAAGEEGAEKLPLLWEQMLRGDLSIPPACRAAGQENTTGIFCRLSVRIQTCQNKCVKNVVFRIFFFFFKWERKELLCSQGFCLSTNGGALWWLLNVCHKEQLQPDLLLVRTVLSSSGFVLVTSSQTGPSSRRALHSNCSCFQTRILPQPPPSIL